ncbi:NAD+ kinase [Winogradskyella wandonensis]|uniref:NAD kinase n=1 Tax=Winogradskyella wandonensis TaxID=1442586 RepID=A0A4R1KSG6_9FLAO|nr:NAD kinase [Winogradskyella wandonensis]TCK67533.1 NAD+ kinase [Winogradskyella wandonensis]
MKVAIYGQDYANSNNSVAFKTLLDNLQDYNIDVFVEEDFLALQDVVFHNDWSIGVFTELDNSYDLLISIGGDGTILRAITYVKDLDINIVGINTGRLGFLATIQTNEIKDALKSIFNGQYKLSKRSLLSVSVSPEHDDLAITNFALNEVTISRKNTTSMITVETHLDDEYLTSYWADGLILATPTGSTGYSLSCGGPVISPETNSFVLTPIAPHNLNARPLVIPDKTKVKLRVSGRENQFLLSLDSRIITLPNSATVKIEKAKFEIKMVELHSESFLDTLRKKMLWGEDRRN